MSGGKSWSTVRVLKEKSIAAHPLFWPVSGPFWVRVGVRVRVRVSGWVGSTSVP